jgi:hypothetical protein
VVTDLVRIVDGEPERRTAHGLEPVPLLLRDREVLLHPHLEARAWTGQSIA